MTQIDLSAYKTLYLMTGRSYLKELVNQIQLLTKDPNNKEVIETMHIGAHSLKSQSLVMGYIETGMLAGTLEKILRVAKDGALELTPLALQAMQEAVDWLGKAFISIEASGKEDIDPNAKGNLERASGITFEG